MSDNNDPCTDCNKAKSIYKDGEYRYFCFVLDCKNRSQLKDYHKNSSSGCSSSESKVS